MTFLSAVSGVGFNKNLVQGLALPNVLEKLFSAVKRIFESASYIARNLTSLERVEIQENWEYEIDHLTNLQILKVEKDPMALVKTRNALRELFQISE